MAYQDWERVNRAARISVAAMLVAIGTFLSTTTKAAEIVPGVGLTKGVDGGGDAKMYGSLAVRGTILPVLDGEIGVAYRDESRFDDALKMRMWPVTASLWLKPFPTIYAGGGVGWYMTTFDWKSETGISDETKQEFGVHLGGGLKMPLASNVAIDLNGRYVMLREQDAKLVPEKFSPDFWMTQVGLAFRF